MISDLPLFEFRFSFSPKPASVRATDKARAIARTARVVQCAAAKADPAWLAVVRDAVLALAAGGAEFTSDDVWEAVSDRCRDAIDLAQPRDTQAAGAVFRALVRERKIEDTNRWIRSERPKAHRKKLTVWRGV